MTEHTDKFLIEIQHATITPIPIDDKYLIQWSEATLLPHCDKAELTLRLVDKAEIHALNLRYRQQDKPTNVLAFPSESPSYVELSYRFLGDVIICPEVIAEESIAQHKTLDAHWAHILIHGILHLLGYDHIKPSDEEIMQNKEILILQAFGFTNPYLES